MAMPCLLVVTDLAPRERDRHGGVRARDEGRVHEGKGRWSHHVQCSWPMPGRPDSLSIGARGRNPVRDDGTAVAGHPDALPFHPAVKIAAAAVLLQEGLEGGEQLGHGARE